MYQCVSIHQIVVILTKNKLNTNIVTIETKKNWWNTFSLTVMDFSLLRKFVPSSITDETFTGLWVIRLVSHNKQKLLTIREQLCPPPGFYWRWGWRGYVSLIVVLFALFYFHSMVLCPMLFVSLDFLFLIDPSVFSYVYLRATPLIKCLFNMI